MTHIVNPQRMDWNWRLTDQGVPEGVVFPGSTFTPFWHNEVLGLSTGTNTSDAAANTSAMQTALTAGGLVQITTPGTYYINDTLTYYDFTQIDFGSGVWIKLYAGTNKRMLQSAAFAATPTSVTLTWSAGVEVSVAWTAHGLTTDDYIVIQGAAQYAYNTVARVGSVTDANNVVVQLQRVPSGSPTGTILARRCTRNFRISGPGGFDFDYTNNSSGSETNRQIAMIGYCANFVIDQLNMRNIYKFGLNLGAVMDYTISNVTGYGTQSGSSSEVVKTYGPARNGLMTGLRGRTTDDFASIQPYEDDLFANYRWSFGDISSITVIGTSSQGSGGQGVHPIYCHDQYYITDIRLLDITANNTAASCNIVPVTRGASSGAGIFGDLIIDGVHGSATGSGACAVNLGALSVSGQSCKVSNVDAYATRQVFAQGAFTCVDLTVEKCTRNVITNTTTSLFFNNCPVKHLRVRDNLFAQAASSTAYAMEVISTSTNIDSIDITGNTINGCTNVRGLQLTVGTVRRAKLADNHMRSSGDAFCIVTGATALTLVARDNDCDAASIINVSSSSAAVTMTAEVGGNVATANSNGFFRFTQATNALSCTIKSDGTNTITNSAHITVVSGTPTLTLYGWDIRVDPIAVTGLAATVGQYCFSTQTGNEGGAAVLGNVNGTPAWYALAGGAAGVNAAIT